MRRTGSLPQRHCEYCGALLARKRSASGKLEAPTDFAVRKFCDLECAKAARRAQRDGKGACAVPNCADRAKSLGLCVAHLHRHYRHGDHTAGGARRLRGVEIRFWSQIDKSGAIPAYRPDLGPCWISGHRPNSKGYPMFSIGKAKFPAYRYSYEQANGPIPVGLEIDHLCRVPMCVRSSHLEAVTHAENMRRMGEAVTRCRRRGHPYTEENVYRSPRGERRCRECARERDRERSPRSMIRAAS